VKILIDIGHPAHVHYFRNAIKIMQEHGHQTIITTRNKDITLQLLKNYSLPYVFTGKNYNSIIGKMFSIIRNDIQILITALKFKPDLFVSFFLPFSAHVGWLLRKPVIGFTDTEHATLSIKLTKRFTDAILTPSCYNKNLGEKQINFNGNMELSYLHHKYFKANKSILEILGVRENERYAILRFVSWNASHDIGHSGLTLEKKIKIVNEISKYVRVFISTEGEVAQELEKFKIVIPPERMHDALAFSSLFIGESGTMASESAVLGIPTIYVNSLPLMGYLGEEKRKGLLFHFNYFEGVLKKAIELLENTNLKQEFQVLRHQFLSEKNDVTGFMIWFIENYPESAKIMKENPDYQNNFR
jgi:uncharacterized protein